MSAPTAQAWNPTHYDRAAAFVPQLGADLIELLAPTPQDRLLDLGSGTGDLTRRLAQSGAQVIGLDASTDMVNEARRKHPDLDFRVGDGQELVFEREFTGVFSNATLHWMPRADDVARGIARALRPGGRFVAEFGGVHCVKTVRDAVNASLSELGLAGLAAPSWFFPTLPEYAACLDRAGLFVRSLLWFERPTRLEGQAGLATWLELFCLPLVQELTARGTESGQDLRAALLRHVERRCESALYRDDAWWLDYTRLRVVASKP
jgi:trans-aconitate methyltransferase